MENHLYHPNMEGKACGLGRHTKRPVRPPYRNPRSGPPSPPPATVTSAIPGKCQLSSLLWGVR